MAINRTIDFLPEYFRTIPNQRFLNSTLDRVISDPELRQFDGFVGRKQINGSDLTGNYITEISDFRSRYQLEPEFVSRQNGSAVKSSGFKDVLNSISVKQGITSAWNRLVTGDAYTFNGFVDLDKLTNYYNYVWIPDARIVNNSRIDENSWYRTPITVSNSNIPLTNNFIVNRTSNGLEVQGYPGVNPELFLARGGTYTFNILPNQNTQALRKPKTVTQANNQYPVVAGPLTVADPSRIFSTNYGKFSANSGLVVKETDDFNFSYNSFTVEGWIWIDYSNLGSDQVIFGQWDFADTINSSWALIRTGDSSLLKFAWVDAISGQINQIETPEVVETGKWHHIAVSRSRSSIKLYVDGYQAITSSVSIIARSSKPLTIGTDTQNTSSFIGYIDDFRITTNYSRYGNLYYEIPKDIQNSDTDTVFLLNFDTEIGGQNFVDNISLENSRVWIQTHPGTVGNIPSNPALTARSIQGVDQNGITAGTITFKVSSLSDESYYRNLNTTGQDFLDFIDLATELNFDQINSAVYDTFIKTPAAGEDSELTGHRGGIDGVKDLNGKTLIFVANQDQGWQFVEPFESTGLETTFFEQTRPVADYQKFGIWQINVVNGLIKLKFVAGVDKEFRLTIKNGSTYRDSSWFKTNDLSEFSRMPTLAGNYTTIYLQDDSVIQNVLPLTINNQETPLLDVDQQIVGKPYYTSGNEIELIDGLHIQFSSDCYPTKYTEPILFYRTKLVNDISNIATQISLLNVEQLLAGNVLEIDSEYMLVVNVNYVTNNVTVSRGYKDSIAVSHTADTLVKVKKTPSYVVEGVGHEITLVPYNSLFTAESYLDIAQDPDYITINKASLDQNPWSRTNRWVNREVINKTLEYLTKQGVEFQEPQTIFQAKRPIVEFRAGLKLFDFGLTALAQVDVFDTNINDALSNVNGRSVNDVKNLTFQGYTVDDGDLIVFANDSSDQVRDKVFEINFITVDNSSDKIVFLKEIASAVDNNCIVVRYGSNRGTNWIYNSSDKNWRQSSQQKVKIQQEPLFDLFDYLGNSYSDTSVYPETNFAGSTLFEYQKNDLSARDPILQFGITYRNIANMGDIVFDNKYGTDQFDYQIDPAVGLSQQVSVNQGVANIVNPITQELQQFIPWQLVRTNLELYQILTVTGSRTIDVVGKMLNKTLAKKPKVFVDSQQISPQYFTQQQLGNIIRTTIDNAITVNSDSTIVLYLLASTPIANAYYQTPETFEINPFNQNPEFFTLSDLKLHTDAIHSHHGHAVTPQSTINSLTDTDHQSSPGLIILHESFSVLPTVMLTDPTFDIDRSVKTAANEYELFKLKFVKAIDQIENIENISAKLAVDAVMQYLTTNKQSDQPWYTSDMVPFGGSKISYTVDDVGQQYYDITVQIDEKASNRAILLYVNDEQWVNGVDYQLFTNRPAVRIDKQLNVDDRIDIYEISNTDGCFVPATPAKLGLAQKFIPRIYTDTTYQEPTKVIEGHDGSIKKTFNDFRDLLILELELRIFNNIKVNNQYWNDIIESRVPFSGKFRKFNSDELYSAEEQAYIQRKFFYEWVAENRVEFRNSVYDFENLFTYNYSGSTDVLDGSKLLGYWRGCYRDFYDTDRPHTAPWEMLGYSIKPSWWESEYGPAPYTGDNGILWGDIKSGYRRGEQTYSPLGARTTNIQKKNSTDYFSVLDIIPVTSDGSLLTPNDCLVAELNTKAAKVGFTFNDNGPVETVWRRSSTYAFAKLRTRIIMNPQFMLGVLWDLDQYKPTVVNTQTTVISERYSGFKFNQTELPSFRSVKLHSVDIESNDTVRKHSVINYVLENLRLRGIDPVNFRTALDSYDVNLVYNLSGFADKNNLAIYAEQNSTQTTNQTVKVPQEDFELVLAESVPVDQAVYSGVIITKTPTGYKITGYDQEYPYFIINPSKVTGKYTNYQLGNLTFVIYQEFEDQPIYIPYEFEFTSRQTVVDFLVCYGERLTRQGFVFDSDLENERINWTDAAIQFIKWSLYKWETNGPSKISLVLNPSSGTLKFSPTAGTLENLLNNRVLIVDENQNKIEQKYIDVFRDDQLTYINNQNPLSVISALRANLINFEHKIVLKNQTVFNDLLFNPVLGTRQQRVRISGIKTGDWNGTLRSDGFLLLRSQVDEWQPNTDYLRGSIVKYKNQNYVALENVIGAKQFQQNKFSVSDVNFQDQLLPSIGAKALDLDHAYDLTYHNTIPDMIRLRCNALGYIERPWLSSLGLDLLNQTEFYRGWIKEKGTLTSIEKFSSAGQSELLADFDLREEYAVKLGEYGATGRTGFVEVLLKNSQLVDEPLAIEFTNNNEISNRLIQVPNSLLYKKSTNWNQNFIQNIGNLKYDEIVFQTAGYVLPNEIYNYAKENTFDYSIELQDALTFSSMNDMIVTEDVTNLIKNVRKGNWIWVAIDDFRTEQNKFNVISWKNSAARVIGLVKNTSKMSIDIYLDRNINLKINDVVAIDHQDQTVNLQGVFKILDYQVLPNSVYNSVLSIEVKNFDQYIFENVQYDVEIAYQSVFTYISLRHSDIGSANLYQLVDKRNLPAITKAYVDSDTTGYAVYDFKNPYDTGETKLPGATVDITYSIAQDSQTRTIWSGKPTANGGNGKVIYQGFMDADLSNNSPIGLSYVSGEITTSSRSDTIQLGSQVFNLTNGFAAAIANDANNRGRMFILQHLSDQDTVLQIFSADGFSSSNNSVYYGQSVSATSDGNWIAVGAPNPNGAGKVLLYRKVENDSTNSVYVQANVSGNSMTLPYASVGTRSLKIFVDSSIQIPEVDYTVNGNALTFTTNLSNSTVSVNELTTYYDLVQVIDDPDGTDTGSLFGSSVSLSDNADVLAVGAPNRGLGKVYAFVKNIQKLYVTTSANTFSLGSNISSYGKINLTVNGQPIPESQYTVNTGSNQLVLTNSVPNGQVIDVDLLEFNLVQTITGTSTAGSFGSQVAVNENFIAISTPRTNTKIGNQNTNNMGKVEIWALNTEVKQTVSVPTSSLTFNSNNKLTVNDWLVSSGSTVNDLVDNINEIYNFTGVSAQLVDNEIFLNIDQNQIHNGIFNVSTSTKTLTPLDSQWILVHTINNNDNNSRLLGKKLRWLSNTRMLAVIEDYVSYIDDDIVKFDINTQFDSGSTLIYASSASQTFDLVLPQTVFNLTSISYTPGKNQIEVYVDGELQASSSYQEVNSQRITFNQEIAAGSTVKVVNTQLGPVSGERFNLYQLLRTKHTYLNTDQDTVQLVRVKTVNYEKANGVNLFFDGNLERLWVGNTLALNESDNVIVKTNEKLLQGWTLNRSQQPTIDTHSIKRAWIYNSRTKEKVVDLDIVDLANGLLPGELAQHIDYITSVDPAVYGIPLWRSGMQYTMGDRVLYSGQVYKSSITHSSLFFNEQFWRIDTAQSLVSNTGSTKWAQHQVGKTWFNTARLRVVDYQQGTVSDRIENFNQWFPDNLISIYEWISSDTPPVNYNGTGTVSADSPFVFDSVTNKFYYWVLNPTQPGQHHSISAADISSNLKNISSSGLKLISPAANNSVILYNTKDLVDAAENVLHIDYVTTDHNNRLHSEFMLLSPDGTNRWLKTPIYYKMIDSLSGIDESNLEVPDTNVNLEDRYGVSKKPRQSMFRDRVKALKIYFEQINSDLKKTTIENKVILDKIRIKQPIPTQGFIHSVPDRETLLTLDVTRYVNGDQLLVENDYVASNFGWSIVKLENLQWQLVTSEFYNLNVFWNYVDWHSDNYVPRDEDYVIPHYGYLPSISPQIGDYIKVLNNGDNNYAIYQVTGDLSLDLIYLQNGTIQFKPGLYDFKASGIGFDASGFDNIGGFDNDPALALRIIIKALNENILVGSLSSVAENAFFAILRYVLQENINIDWLFKSSFVSVKHKVKNLNFKTNYRKDNEQFVLEFIEETKPYHTRVREYVNVYTVNDTAQLNTTDFDLPALYDETWLKAQYAGTTGKKLIGPMQWFIPNAGVVEDQGIVYVNSNGLANHPMGLWPGVTNRNVQEHNWVFAITRFPSESLTKYPVLPNNAVGIAINGIPFYSVVSEQTDTLVWAQDQSIKEVYTVNIGQSQNYVGPDAGNGYLTNQDWYVYRKDPVFLYEKNNTQHSSIIGYALDGFPIYGPYGFKNSDGSGGIILNTSSYILSSTPRLSRPLGDPNLGVVNGTQYAEYDAPTGEYIEDYEYIQGIGTLDQHNGRFVVTPEYPYGTYAYFVTIDPITSAPVYPYIIGPSFKGQPTGLKFEYRGENVVPIYDNGNYIMPPAAPNVNELWPLRTPTGLFPNDLNRFQQAPYVDWYQNYTYDLIGINVAQPGYGYTLNPDVTISGGGSATAIINPQNGSIISVTLRETVAGLTSIPVITVNDFGLIFTEWSSTSVEKAVEGEINSNLLNMTTTAGIVVGMKVTGNTGLGGPNYTSIVITVNPTSVELKDSHIDNISGNLKFFASYSPGQIVSLAGRSYYEAKNKINEINDVPYTELTLEQRVNYWDEYWTLLPIKPAVLTPILENKTSRKIHSTIKFDRVSGRINQFDLADSYAPGETVYYNQSFYIANANLTTSVIGIVPGNIGSENIWTLLSDENVAQTEAAVRATQLYKPSETMLSNDLTQLLYGAEFPGVFVDGLNFTDYYIVPTGKLNDQSDQLRGNVGIMLEFDSKYIYQNAYSYAQKINGTRAGSTATSEFNNTVQFGSQENNVTFVTSPGVEPRYFTADTTNTPINTHDFTIEFYFKMKELNRQQVLLDTRDGVNGGFVIYVNSSNHVCVTDDASTYVLSMGDVTTSKWHHVAVEKNIEGVNLYFDGNKISQGYKNYSYSNYSFDSTTMTIGASYDVNANTVANSLIDDLRLTVGICRYNSDTYSVDYGGFNRNNLTDPYYGYVYILYGFEGTSNEIIGRDVEFVPQGSRAVVQDSSVTNKIVTINNNNNLLLQQLPLEEPQLWSSLVTYQVGDQVKSNEGEYYLSLISGANIALTDTESWRPIVPTNPLFTIPSAVFANSNVYLDAGSSLDYNLGVDDFTVEFWVNPSVTAGAKTIFELATDSNVSLHGLTSTVTTINSNSIIDVNVINGAQTVATLTSGNITATPIFVSIERYRQTLTLFVNGQLVDQVSNATWSLGDPNQPINLIVGNDTNGFVGKLADFRLTKLSARHLPTRNVDSEISSEFLDQYLGVKAEDIRVDGTGFVTDVNSPATEEHINGRLYETLNIRVFSKPSVETNEGTIILSAKPTGFRIFKDMMENITFYGIPASATTELSANLNMFDTEISVASTQGFVDPDLNQRGVVFVGAERITYLTVDRENNKLKGLMRSTLGTSISTVHPQGTRVEAAGSTESLPGETQTIGVVRTVKYNTSNSVQVQLDKVSGIVINQLVTGLGVSANTTVVSVDFTNKSVTLSSPHSFTAQQLLKFGDIDPVTVRPFNYTSTNSYAAYRDTWYNTTSASAADGRGLQRSTTPIANYLIDNPAVLPE